MAHSLVVAGLGYGDEGKGSIVDALVRRHNADLVVRYNGGHQAGHNVVLPDGRHHTFSQFGAGTLAGARTFLSRFMVIEPIAMRNEGRALGGNTTWPIVDRECLVTTCYHKLVNQAREAARGGGRHGSCGVGVGATVEHAMEYPGRAIRAGDLRDRNLLRAKLELQRSWALEQNADRTEVYARIPDIIADKLQEATRFEVVDREWLDAELDKDGTVVFEGAQGILLDQDYGFFPYCTWSKCTQENALKLIGNRSRTCYGVLRPYAHRHGPGPLVTEDPGLAIDEPHNPTGVWQGAFRVGHFDMLTAMYATRLVNPDVLALTHVDWLRRQREVSVCCRYLRFNFDLVARDPEDMDGRRARTDRLLVTEWGQMSMRPEYLLETLEQGLGVSIAVLSNGPTWQDKTWVE